MLGVDDPESVDDLAFLMDSQVELHDSGGCREVEAVASGEREVCAFGWEELAEEAPRARVDLRAGPVEARHPEVPVAGEYPRVVEIPARPLLDQAVFLHVEEHDAGLQRPIRDAAAAARKQGRRSDRGCGDDRTGKGN